MRHYLVGSLFALALFGGLTVGAGIFDNEWPDAIMCKIEGKEGAERQVILQLASLDKSKNKCGGAGGAGQSVRGYYRSSFLDYTIDFCSETTVPDAKPEIISKDFANCKLGVTIRDLEKGGQTRNFK
jgi:hypothetical protein